jgi:hypothetical protein
MLREKAQVVENLSSIKFGFSPQYHKKKGEIQIINKQHIKMLKMFPTQSSRNANENKSIPYTN